MIVRAVVQPMDTPGGVMAVRTETFSMGGPKKGRFIRAVVLETLVTLTAILAAVAIVTLVTTSSPMHGAVSVIVLVVVVVPAAVLLHRDPNSLLSFRSERSSSEHTSTDTCNGIYRVRQPIRSDVRGVSYTHTHWTTNIRPRLHVGTVAHTHKTNDQGTPDSCTHAQQLYRTRPYT